MQVRRSPLDEARFGMAAARADGVTAADVPALLAFCAAESVRLLMVRTADAAPAGAQAFEEAGFRLMDTLVYYGRPVDDCLPAAQHTLRPAVLFDAPSVAALAAEAFRDYGGHYHADSRLPRDLCDGVYVSWAERSVAVAGVADGVLLAEEAGKLVGFVTLRLNSATEGEVPLYGVHPAAQGRGIGRSLIAGALAWFRERGAARMVISTQVTNIASQTVWIRCGFTPITAHYSFHRWFD